MHYFEQLGSHVGDLWKKHDFNERSFPEVAHEALLRFPPETNTSLADALDFGLRGNSLPAQSDLEAIFGQPPLTVYKGREFEIQVLFWIGGTPAIHQHSFSGAFAVMHGSSLHLEWGFDPEHQVCSHLILGKLHLRKAEFLHVGDHRAIIAGNRFIHTTFHLEKPTVSLVVRTGTEQLEKPQYAYDPPTVAFDPDCEIVTLKRREQILAMLANSGQTSEYDKWVRSLLADADAFAAFRYLRQSSGLIRDDYGLEELLQHARKHHPKLVEKLEPALRNMRRQRGILQLRDKVTDAELRIFLAVLANVPDKQVVLDLLRELYPAEDPIVKLVSFIQQLCNADLLGEGFDEQWLCVFECLLRKIEGEGIEKALAAKCGEPNDAGRRMKIAVLEASIPHYWLIRPLLAHVADSPLAAATVTA
jgi:hypothetical protein